MQLHRSRSAVSHAPARSAGGVCGWSNGSITVRIVVDPHARATAEAPFWNVLNVAGVRLSEAESYISLLGLFFRSRADARLARLKKRRGVNRPSRGAENRRLSVQMPSRPCGETI